MSPGVLVGRDAEIAQLKALRERAVLGRGQSVLIEGEPGIGKSALLDIVARDCAELGVHLLRGVAEEMDQQVPFAAIASCLGVEASTPAWITSLLQGDGVEEPADMRSVANREFAVTEAIVDLMEQWCATGPVALLLDDLQWADPASLQVLHRLGRTIRQIPLLMVATCRPVPRDEELERLLRSLQAHGATAIRLGPLDGTEVAGLVARLAGGRAGPDLLHLVAGAAGNPLYVTELVDALVPDGRVRADGGVVEVNGAATDTAPAPVPQSLPGAIMRRLDFLSRRARDVLEVAAVLGPGLRLTELSTILDLPASELLTVIREAVTAGLLTESGQQLVFRHALIRQALAENVPTEVRTALHLQAGRALATGGAQVDRVAHYLLAGNCVDSWVLDWLLQSAEPLVSRAPTLAVEMLTRALSDIESDDKRAQALRFQTARALLWAGRPAEAGQIVKAALAASGEARRDAALRWLQAQASFQQGRLRDAQIIAEEALASANLSTVDSARFLHFAAQCRLTRGELNLPQEEAIAQALIARGDPDSTAYGLYYLSGVRYVQERMADSLELMERALVAFGTPEALPDWDVPIQMYRAYIMVELDQLEDAEKAFEVGLRQADRHGSFYLTWYHLGKARMNFLDGRWDDALAEIQAGMDAIDALAKVRGVQTRRGLRAQAALIAIHRGDRAVSAAVAKEPHQASRSAFYDYLGRWAQALAWEATGEPRRALDSLLAYWEEGAGYRLQRGLHYLCPDIARLAVSLGDPAPIERIVAGLADLVSRQPTPTLSAIHAYCRASLDADPDRLMAAAESFQKAGRPLYQAYAQEAAAAIMAARGRTSE